MSYYPHAPPQQAVPEFMSTLGLGNIPYPFPKIAGWGNVGICEVDLTTQTAPNKKAAWSAFTAKLIDQNIASPTDLITVSRVWFLSTDQQAGINMRLEELNRILATPGLAGDFMAKTLHVSATSSVTQSPEIARRRMASFKAVRAHLNRSYHAPGCHNSAGVIGFDGVKDFAAAKTIALYGYTPAHRLKTGYYGTGIYNAGQLGLSLEFAERGPNPVGHISRYVVVTLNCVGAFFPVVERPTEYGNSYGHPIRARYNNHIAIVSKQGPDRSSYYPVPPGAEVSLNSAYQYVSNEGDVFPIAIMELMDAPVYAGHPTQVPMPIMTPFTGYPQGPMGGRQMPPHMQQPSQMPMQPGYSAPGQPMGAPMHGFPGQPQYQQQQLPPMGSYQDMQQFGYQGGVHTGQQMKSQMPQSQPDPTHPQSQSMPQGMPPQQSILPTGASISPEVAPIPINDPYAPDVPDHTQAHAHTQNPMQQQPMQQPMHQQMPSQIPQQQISQQIPQQMPQQIHQQPQAPMGYSPPAAPQPEPLTFAFYHQLVKDAMRFLPRETLEQYLRDPNWVSNMMMRVDPHGRLPLETAMSIPLDRYLAQP